jgi:hypothetical protein
MRAECACGRRTACHAISGLPDDSTSDLASGTSRNTLEVAIVASTRNGELLGELEEEMHYAAGEGEEEYEDEAFLGGLIGRIFGGGGDGESEEELGELPEFEEEMHYAAGEGEEEYEDEAFLGGLIGRIFGGGGGGDGESEEELVHELSHEIGGMGEFEGFGETEWEGEAPEAFFGGLIRRALPALRNVARSAVPAIAGAFGGPLGSVIGGLFREGEIEGEFAHELGGSGEMHEMHEMHELPEIAHEMHEVAHEMHEVGHEYEAHAEAEVTESEAHAELMAAAAAGAQSEAEAEALIGAATLAALTPRERRQLRRALAHMVRATAILTRLLRRRRITRPMVRTVPTIVHHTARTLANRQARTGRPITRGQAARVMSVQTGRVLTNPRLCGLALRRNVRATRRMQRVARVPIRGTGGATYRRRRVRY